MVFELKQHALPVLVLLIASYSAYSQVADDRRSREAIVRENLEQRMNNMRNLDSLARKTGRTAEADMKTRYFRPELTKELEEQLEVDPSAIDAYRGIFDQPNTGAVRLIAQKDCTGIKRERKLADCYQENSNIREFANAYSFREQKRTVFGRSDIALSRGFIIAGRHSVQTILADLGTSDIGRLTPESPEIAYLFGFVPRSDPAGMDAQYDELKNGLTVANYDNGRIGEKQTYSKAARILPDRVYAIRAIAYRSPDSSPGEKDADVIVVFKIVETDDEGGATIVWRELSRKEGLTMRPEDFADGSGR